MGCTGGTGSSDLDAPTETALLLSATEALDATYTGDFESAHRHWNAECRQRMPLEDFRKRMTTALAKYGAFVEIAPDELRSTDVRVRDFADGSAEVFVTVGTAAVEDLFFEDRSDQDGWVQWIHENGRWVTTEACPIDRDRFPTGGRGTRAGPPLTGVAAGCRSTPAPVCHGAPRRDRTTEAPEASDWTGADIPDTPVRVSGTQQSSPH